MRRAPFAKSAVAMLGNTSMSEPPKRVRRKRRASVKRQRGSQIRRAILLSLCLLGGIGVALFAFSSVHKGWNQWRESRLLKQANDFLEHGNLAGAEKIAHAALDIA